MLSVVIISLSFSNSLQPELGVALVSVEVMEVLSAWTWVVGPALVLLLGASCIFPKFLERKQATKFLVQGDWGLPIFGEYFQFMKQGGRDFLYGRYVR